MTNITPSTENDIRFTETPAYFYPLALKITNLDYSISTYAIYRSLIKLFRYLLCYHEVVEVNDFYDGLRRSTHETHLQGRYYNIFKKIMVKYIFNDLRRQGYYMEYKIKTQMPDIIIRHFCENKITERLLSENLNRR